MRDRGIIREGKMHFTMLAIIISHGSSVTKALVHKEGQCSVYVCMYMYVCMYVFASTPHWSRVAP